jgi:hypothetical protein
LNAEPFRHRTRFDDDGIEAGRGPGEEAVIKRNVLVGVGVLIALAGIIFTLQGLGAIGGSSMSGVTFWAVAGPVIALAGLALAAVGLRRRSAS